MRITADRVLETSTSTGTTALTLAGAVTGYRTFGSACANNDTCYYSIWAVDAAGNPTGQWETGLGTWATGGTLTRTSVHASSSAGAAVDFAAGTKRVAMTAVAKSFPYDDGVYEMPDPGTATQNTSALLAALQSGKGVVQFQAGEYVFNGAVTNTIVGRTIRGRGAARTTLKMEASHTVDFLFVSSAGASGTIIEELTFDGNCPNSTNIYCGLLKADQSTITNKFTLRDCKFTNIRLYLIRLWPGSTDFIMDRCRIEDVEDWMIEATPWYRGTIRDCVFFNYSMDPTYSSSTGCILVMQGGSDGWIIEGNQFYPHVTNGYFAIESVWDGETPVRGMVFANNVLDARNALNGNNAGTGVSGCFEGCTFTGNVWKNGAGSAHVCGLEVVGRRNTVTGNTIHNGQFAFGSTAKIVGDPKGAVVSGNTFIQNRTVAYPAEAMRQSDSIRLYNAVGVLVEGNSFWYEQGHMDGGNCINVEGSTADLLTIRNNVFQQHAMTNNTVGIKVDTTVSVSGVIIEGNTFDKLYRGINLDMTGASEVHVKRNYFYDCDLDLNESGGKSIKSGNITSQFVDSEVNAEDYGVFGDGGDYTTQLQAAIDALDVLVDVNGVGQRTLALPSGTVVISSTITLKAVNIVSASRVPNGGTRVIWNGTAGGTMFQAHASDFNSSFWLLEGINFRSGTTDPGVMLDLSTAAGYVDAFCRVRECHFNDCTSHAIKVGGWINAHWEHLRFDHVGGFAVLLTVPNSSLSLSTFSIDGFTYDHNRSTEKGWGVIGVNNAALASNVGSIELSNGRIEVNATWDTRVAAGTLGAARAVFSESSGGTGTTRSIGWKLRNVTYSDASGMSDDGIVFRNTSAASSDYAVSLSYDNVRTANLSAVFTGAVGTRLAGVPTNALAGIGSINPAASNSAFVGYGAGNIISGGNGSPESVVTASRGSIYMRYDGGAGTTMYVKETGDNTNTGWYKVTTTAA